jgi:hypothetical protein
MTMCSEDEMKHKHSVWQNTEFLALKQVLRVINTLR